MAAAAALTGKLTDVRKVTDWKNTPAKAKPRLEMAADTAEIESDDDIERIGDYPVDGQQTGVESTKKLSTGTGMVPFTQLRGFGRPDVERLSVQYLNYLQRHHLTCQTSIPTRSYLNNSSRQLNARGSAQLSSGL